MAPHAPPGCRCRAASEAPGGGAHCSQGFGRWWATLRTVQYLNRRGVGCEEEGGRGGACTEWRVYVFAKMFYREENNRNLNKKNHNPTLHPPLPLPPVFVGFCGHSREMAMW
ncbi:UNVERIFIED_CONTAM: hypothetical protein K2H54_046444 [Gekko kuhli]